MADAGILWTIRIGLTAAIVFTILFLTTLVYYGGTRLLSADAISEFIFSILFVVMGSYAILTITKGLVKRRMEYLDTIIGSWSWLLGNNRKRLALTLFLVGIGVILLTTGRTTFIDEFISIPKFNYPPVLLSFYFFPITALETIIFPYSVFARVFLGLDIFAAFSRLLPYFFEIIFFYWISSIFFKTTARPLFKDSG